MKKYTHAWLAFMAIKRLEYAAIPEKYQTDAKTLVKWFKSYRDFVIDGSWYPDEVFKDMATSHVIKYRPSLTEEDMVYSASKWRRLPDNVQVAQLVKNSEFYGQRYVITSGNLPDRCEAFSHSLVDSFKMLTTEDKGCPISPTNNHIAMRFFILSHYICDCHMPLHCDSRSFSSYANIHAMIEEAWDKQVSASYSIDKNNERFFYDPEGYPLKKEITPMMQKVEESLKTRPFIYEWGTKNNNAYDYMAAVSQYSYLMAYHMIPIENLPAKLTRTAFKEMEFWKNIDDYSAMIFEDAIDSVAKIWLHAWHRYREWAKL